MAATKKSLGRLTYVHPSSGELFYFHMLLCHQKGCKSPVEVRTVEGEILPTYKAACEALRLFGDDKEWDILWNKYWEAMSDDILRKVSEAIGIPNYHVNTAELQGYILYNLEAILNGFEKSVKDFGLQAPPEHLLKDLDNKLLMEEKNYNRELLMQDAVQSIPKSLKDLMNAPSLLFGGKTVVLGVCLLTVNMRLLRSGLDHEQQSEIFAKWLLDVRNGEIGDPDEQDNEDSCWITVLPEYCVTSDAIGMSQLIDLIYDDTTLKTPTAAALQEKAIVCPKNANADAVNAKILSLIEGHSRTYLSKDEALPVGKETGETELLLSGTMSENTIASPRIGQENSVLEARVYRKWISKSMPGMKEMAFCCILIDKEFVIETRTQNDISNLDSDVTPFGDANKVCDPAVYIVLTNASETLSSSQCGMNLQNILTKTRLKRYRLQSSLPSAPVESQNTKVSKYRYEDPEQEKMRNRQTLETLLQQNPASFKGIRFKCEAIITSVAENRDWNYSSCSQCSKKSTGQNDNYTCKDHGKQDPPTYRYNFKATPAIETNNTGTMLTTSTSAITQESADKDKGIPGTPPDDVAEQIAQAIVSTIPNQKSETVAKKEGRSSATIAEPKPTSVKRALLSELSSDEKKKK
ncbi:DNA helicase [Tanacetum coccineum]